MNSRYENQMPTANPTKMRIPTIVPTAGASFPVYGNRA
jgi:hypothetical protein